MAMAIIKHIQHKKSNCWWSKHTNTTNDNEAQENMFYQQLIENIFHIETMLCFLFLSNIFVLTVFYSSFDAYKGDA